MADPSVITCYYGDKPTSPKKIMMIDDKNAKRVVWPAIIGKLVFSVLVAYPMSGAIYAVNIVIHSPRWYHIGEDLFFVVYWMLLVSDGEGLVSISNDGPIVNMYPWIVPIAVILFFCFSNGWRWFKRRRG
jgi:hypothetical protein